MTNVMPSLYAQSSNSGSGNSWRFGGSVWGGQGKGSLSKDVMPYNLLFNLPFTPEELISAFLENISPHSEMGDIAHNFQHPSLLKLLMTEICFHSNCGTSGLPTVCQW